MIINKTGLDFIKRWESCVLTAYADIAGIPTIGWGTTMIDGKRVQLGMTITAEQAEQYLADDCIAAENAVNRLIFVGVSLTQNNFNALISFIYNVGIGGFHTSTLYRKLAAREPVLEDYFLRWNKITDVKTGKLVASNGLTNRRKAEYQLYVTP